ncbi:MAG: hypothetical protein ACXWPM_11335 [Bdellovibrionota bacterium]
MRNRLGFLAPILASALISANAFALDNIIHPWVSSRNLGMGGVMITTGLYDDNFFGNPARVTANPIWRVGLPLFLDLYAELDPGLITNVGGIAGALSSGSALTGILTAISASAGTPAHMRLQMPLLPTIYVGGGEHRWALAIMPAMFSTQTDVVLRGNSSLNFQSVTDAGASVTFGYAILPEKALSFGVTGHYLYRLSTATTVALASLISGSAPTLALGDSTGFDFDFGVTYNLPFHPLGFVFEFGATGNNLLGGNYTIGSVFSVFHNAPLPQPRSIGFGFSALKPTWWKLKDTVFAIDFNDILNNGSMQNGVFVNDGSFFRTIHLGAETHLSILTVRAGINQGYLSAGVGIDTKIFSLDLLTYGEEMGLNTGSVEDRRFGLHWSLHI